MRCELLFFSCDRVMKSLSVFQGRCCTTFPRRAGKVSNLRWTQEEPVRVLAHHRPPVRHFCHQQQSIVGSRGTWPIKKYLGRFEYIWHRFLKSDSNRFRWFSMTRAAVALDTGIVFSGLNIWQRDTTWQQRWVRCVLLSLDPPPAVPRSALTTPTG